MQANSESNINISSPLISKKLNRTPIRKAFNKSKKDPCYLESNLNKKNIKLTLNDEAANESHVEIDFDANILATKVASVENHEKNSKEHLSFPNRFKSLDFDCKCADEIYVKKNNHLHRHRNLRKRHFKINSNINKKMDSNESIDDSDSKMIPFIKFNNAFSTISYPRSDSNVEKEIRYENNIVKSSNLFTNKDDIKKIKIRSTNLNRNYYMNQSTPNLKSISLEEIDIITQDSISNDEKTFRKYSSNMELSSKDQQIYKLNKEKIILNNNKKIVTNDIKYLAIESSQILLNNKNNNSKKLMQRFKLIVEGDVNICKLTHNKNVFTKILSSKLLRRWKTHRLTLQNSGIISATKSDDLENGIPYHTIIEVSPISKWEPGQKYCFRIATLDCHYLIQANNVYVRDQWINSIIWKKQKFKSERVLRLAVRPEVLIKEIKWMVEMSLTTPIEDNEVYQHPLELVSEILQKQNLPKQMHEEIIVCLSPLLEKNHPSPEICDFFSKHCKNSPRSHIVIEMFTPVVQRILKHNGDFGRYPRMRIFIQDYLTALMSQNEGLETVQNFVVTMHSPTTQCPFPRVLPNFVSVCLAAIHSCFEQRKKSSQPSEISLSKQEKEDQLICHTKMMYTMSKFDDWILNLAQLLQSVPFPDQALANETFIKIFKKVVENFANDSRCEVHQALLGIREGKEGWFEIFCPGGISCDDEGELFSTMLKRLIGCCCKKKRFLLGINSLLSQIMVLAVREVPSAIETLCAMLDFDGVENSENKLQIISTLQSTNLGIKMYAKVCERQMQLRELQQKGGPRKLTLPSRSTDEDLAKLLLSGSFGNLECLSLAFTNVTSACAEYLIKLPSLRYLNLWSTKFGDEGLELISEHLQRLQVLNLCETPVTDKGLACLASMKQLRKLNLNSTNLSALTFEGLKECLPALQECDIRYTDAW